MSGGGKGDSPRGYHQPPAEKGEGTSLFKRREGPKGQGRIRPGRESGEFSWLGQQRSDLLTNTSSHSLKTSARSWSHMISQYCLSSAPRNHHELSVRCACLSAKAALLGSQVGQDWGPGDISDMHFTIFQLATKFSHLSAVDSEGRCKALRMLLLGTSPTRKRQDMLRSPRIPAGDGACRRRTQEKGRPSH